MRKEETLGIFKGFDLLGRPNLYTRTHKMFFHFADGTITPINTEGEVIDDRVWSNHLGGIEGLRQKG